MALALTTFWGVRMHFGHQAELLPDGSKNFSGWRRLFVPLASGQRGSIFLGLFEGESNWDTTQFFGCAVRNSKI